ncbi:MAG: hypothetical protein K6F50_09775, partial [Kiritimatiellae bacterium]|nr:hypothetical protein [Kiritimatiellia bacterium]
RVSVKDGKIYLDGDKMYKGLVIRHDALDLDTMEKVAAMAKAGAKICGVKPRRTLRLLNRAEETAKLRALSDEIWGEDIARKAPREAVDIAFDSAGDASTMFTRHVKKGGKDIYFLASAFDLDARDVTLAFTARNDNRAVVLDPQTGRKYAICGTDGTIFHHTRFTLHFRPRQSLVVIFGESANGLPSYEDELDAVAKAEIHLFDSVLGMRGKGRLTFESDPDIEPIEFRDFRSLTESENPDIKYYTGVLRYDFGLVIPDMVRVDREKETMAFNRVFLTIPRFGSTAEVTVNGRNLGTVWDPYMPLEITPALEMNNMNLVRFSIRVTNPWRNRLIGDLFQDRGEKASFTTSPGIDKYDMKPHISRKADLIPTGISAPLVISVSN